MTITHPFRVLLCLLLLPLLQSASAALPAAIEPEQIAIVYQMESKESQALAVNYARARGIPSGNLVALNLPESTTISRSDFESRIRNPLIDHFDREIWWHRTTDSKGVKVPVRNKIRVLLLMKGVPYRIKREARPGGEGGKPSKPPIGREDEASVDSELVYLGLSNYEVEGPLNNPYYQKDSGISDASLIPLLFTCRIDGPTYEVCQRIIDDSLEIEKTGLWGTCYLDEALKGKNYEIGDEWMRAIARQNRKEGIPTVIERTRDTFPTNYPMTDAALYYGWYAANANGPLLNPNFRFKKGAVAIHLHSFSATTIEDPKKKWVGPILNKGAAATVGNVWEPYLTGTHNFDILHDRLLKGYSLVEAAHMSIPVHSWQSVVIGDPLYRPFLSQNQSPVMAEDDKDYRAFRLGIQKWSAEPETLAVKLRTAAARMNSGRLYESLGLRFLQENKIDEAKAFFNSAARTYPGEPDKLRQTLHLISIHRGAGDKQAALELVTDGLNRFQNIPESKSLLALKNILDPPAPPAAKSKAQ
ncbi:TIGR03790 family protein [Roseibacillus persicicus]|uniref:TIGR03790 family protein n=1 Tax=Roseibacillus persicicus TaxID=454148 RepID=UPI00280C615D|nr:TIGR03790 family protein [Roseibacillus persicicus]MDQ8190958.1 TIGR03790 family protein [Roseibacillus persicicus]